ncbi:SCO1664 family protein [Litorilinea aerophila]|nr:SCO1664 family protein [Litorilinea aerophila]MCC9075468.1 SCO1664 family protein [Litorilinea aerophila]GIV76351.1 MAG: hypothetical protein KatS3mg050_0745 [Litorilinea sp.]
MAAKRRARPHSGPDPIQLNEAEVLEILTAGRMEEQGLLPYSSNHSFLVTVTHQQCTLPAVYKPRRGESPLWDFEWGSLCLRETAAYLVSHGLGWRLVPPTVLREGTRGLGSVQFYVDNDENEHYFTVQADARYAQSLRQLALFDFVINNADRKSGHCLIGTDGRLWAIDHGVCFHSEYKLRTVIWEFSGQPIEEELLAGLQRLEAQLTDMNTPLAQSLCQLLNDEERAAMLERLRLLLHTRTFPEPSPFRRNYPWPPI